MNPACSRTTAATLFDTAVGRCGVAWNDHDVVVRFQLPEGDDAATLRRVARGGTAVDRDPPRRIREVIEGVRRHLDGRLDDLRWVALDLAGVPEFDQAVYGVARSIAPGDTMTYGAIAAAIELPGAAQAVGQALGRNPIPMLIPCHRVLAANGRIGGFSAYGSIVAKRRLLEIERAPGFTDLALF